MLSTVCELDQELLQTLQKVTRLEASHANTAFYWGFWLSNLMRLNHLLNK